ncbi:MAG: MATE family efflux transporter [Dorea sp.]
MSLEGKSLKKDFFKFIIPAVIAQWVFALYTMVDAMFVARGVSETALAAVNISSPFVNGMFATSLTFAVGTSTIIAMLFGQKETKKAQEVFSQNILVLSILSLVVTALVLMNLESFCSFLGATGSTMPFVKEYIETLAPFAICFILSYTFEILISTDGYPQLATIIVLAGVILNCVLDYLLIIVFHKGVWGAAFATGVSQAAVIVLYLIHFLGKKGTIKFCKFQFHPSQILREARNGFPSGITELSAGIITFVFNQTIIHFLNEDALVSYSVIAYINSIFVMTMIGVAQGCQPLISYYYGKKELKKCKKLLKYEIFTVLVASVFALGFCYLITEVIVGAFISKELVELTAYSMKVFRIFILSFLIVGYNIVIAGFFTAIEKTVPAVVIAIGRGFVTLVISVAALTAMFGGDGIWYASLISEILCLIVSITLFQMLYCRKEK